jgi:hypothetical protein
LPGTNLPTILMRNNGSGFTPLQVALLDCGHVPENSFF